MSGVIELATILATLAVLAIAAVLAGADTRDGFAELADRRRRP